MSNLIQQQKQIKQQAITIEVIAAPTKLSEQELKAMTGAGSRRGAARIILL